MSFDFSKEEEGALIYIDGIGQIKWRPFLGVPKEYSVFIASTFDEKVENGWRMIHLFFKPNTYPVYLINLKNDREVARCILEILKKHYPDQSYKLEFYDLGYAGIPLQAMVILVKETPFSNSPDFRHKVLTELDRAFRTEAQKNAI